MLAVEQLSRSSSEVRKEWSSTIDATVRLRPQFVQRTHDNITMLNTVMLAELLGNCKNRLAKLCFARRFSVLGLRGCPVF
ncbi:MAG: hypothetical protein J5899_02370 [Acidaminococcaceae bacterium]|nr:hypothetical protein [Acidaminococcaceae bacterium]